MPELSPAAQACVAAWVAARRSQARTAGRHDALAAFAEALADQVVPGDYDPPRGISYPEKEAFIDGKCVLNEDVRCEILAIAAELRGEPTTTETQP